MIDLYYWPTANGHKITMFLEETGLDYAIHPVNTSAGDQFKPEFLAFSPNKRMPAIIDRDPAGGGEPVTVFKSGAILLYLAEKTGRFLPTDLRGRKTVTEWLFWQMGGLGPMAGQNHHFGVYAPEKIPYAINRYANETNRLTASWIAGRRIAHPCRRRVYHRRHGGLSVGRALEAPSNKASTTPNGEIGDRRQERLTNRERRPALPRSNTFDCGCVLSQKQARKVCLSLPFSVPPSC